MDPRPFLQRLGISGRISAGLMILFGIAIIMFPGISVWLVGIYLIVAGVVAFLGNERLSAMIRGS